MIDDVNPIKLFEPALATGDEKALLKTHLRLVQQSLLRRLDGLSDEDLRRPMTATSTNLIGIVKHLSGVTCAYLCSSFGRESETFPWQFDEEFFFGLDMWATPDESTAEIIAAYERACDAAARTIDELDLDATGKHHTGLTVSLRWMILIVLLDTTRHAGHADILREEIDGSIGDGGSVHDDEERWRLWRALLKGELDRQAWLAFNRGRPDYDPSEFERFLERAWGPKETRPRH